MRVVYGIGEAVPSHERSLACRYRDRVAAEVEIAPIAAEEFEQVLPLYDSTGAERSEWVTYELRV